MGAAGASHSQNRPRGLGSEVEDLESQVDGRARLRLIGQCVWPPHVASLSHKKTSWPALCSSQAEPRPAMPLPTTATRCGFVVPSGMSLQV